MPAAEPFVFQGCVQACELLLHEVHDARKGSSRSITCPCSLPSQRTRTIRSGSYSITSCRLPTGHQARTLWEFRDAFSGIDVTTSVVSG
jgi:hypothetical protein